MLRNLLENLSKKLYLKYKKPCLFLAARFGSIRAVFDQQNYALLTDLDRLRKVNFTTLYHKMGINLSATTIRDSSGRPQYLLDHHEPIPELV